MLEEVFARSIAIDDCQRYSLDGGISPCTEYEQVHTPIIQYRQLRYDTILVPGAT